MKKFSAQLLESGIIECLGGPGGDPDAHHVKAAAIMAKVLIEEGFAVDQDTMDSIRGKNADGCDFLEEVEAEWDELTGDQA